MITRIDIENRELSILSEFATKSSESKGRLKEEEQCSVRTVFQRDRDRIIHSKAFRRLMHKTQVFLAPEGDHYRTRLTHTIEVSQIARTISRGLSLNEDLTEAIALGHDLGHTPFGHSGESIINEIYSRSFKHNVQSLRVADVLEFNSGKRGMNLTMEVRDGILNHTGSILPSTPEGQVVRTSDRIAYINHDIDDAIRSGILTVDNLPEESLALLGRTHKERIDTLVKDMIKNSEGKSCIELSEEKQQAMNNLRAFMFENVYHNKEVKRAEVNYNIRTVLSSLFDYYKDNPEFLPADIFDMKDEYTIEELVKDHIASMTDRYACNKYMEIFNKNMGLF